MAFCAVGPFAPRRVARPTSFPPPVKARPFPLSASRPFPSVPDGGGAEQPLLALSFLQQTAIGWSSAKSGREPHRGNQGLFERALAARGGFVSPGDALYKNASLAVYSAPRYNVDPLYFLRTLGDYDVGKSASCNIDAFGATLKRDLLTGDSRRLPFEVVALRGNPLDSCMPPPMADVRARIVVSAYLHARRRP